jgi:ribosomal-protein-alanine N-acetyltransferase
MSPIQAFFDSQPEFLTPRLLLRRLRPADAAAMFEYASRSDVGKYVMFHEHQSIKDSEDFIATVEMQSGTGFGLVWAMELRESGRMIGTIGIHNVNLEVGSVEAGYALHPDAWGKGYATEALRGMIGVIFEQSPIDRIEAHHVAEHIASGRVMEKAGMQYEGCLRQARTMKGIRRDMKVYSILRSEYEASHH